METEWNGAVLIARIAELERKLEVLAAYTYRTMLAVGLVNGEIVMIAEETDVETRLSAALLFNERMEELYNEFLQEWPKLRPPTD